MTLKIWNAYDRLLAADLNANFAAVLANAGAIVPPTIRVYTADATWSKPVGPAPGARILAFLVIELIGAGGGGGGTPATSSNEACGGGGGGGGYARKILAASVLPATCAITIGQGGAGGAAGANAGSAGGLTRFAGSGVTSIDALGGGGGSAGANTSGFYSAGGTGGGSANADLGVNGATGSAHKLAGTSATGAGWGAGNALVPEVVPQVFGSSNFALPAGSYGIGGVPASALSTIAARAGGVGGNGLAILTEWFAAFVP